MTHPPLATILVATDFSETAALALDWGAELAAAHGSRLVLVHALPLPAVPALPSAGVAVPPPVAAHRDAAGERLRELAERLATRDLRVDVEVTDGAAGDAVAAAAEAHGAGLVVVGTQGETGLKRLVLGSVAARLAQECPCPLLTVRSGTPPAVPKRVLVPIGPDDDLLALEAARRVLPADARPGWVLLHAFPRPAGFYQYGKPAVMPQALDEERARAQERMQELAAGLRRDGCDVAIQVRDGNPADVIEEEAAAGAVDLLAMATRGLGGIERIALGSTTRHVLPRVPCPVLSVRRGADD